MAEKRRADEQTSAQEPHSGVQGEGGPGCSQGEKTLAELAEQFDIHPNQITQWKSSSQEGAAVVDWFSRRVLAWKLSITMEASFCIEALEEALSRNEKPEIFNTDQGSQFTSEAFTGRLKEEGIKISMDGKGRWRDNVFVERIWKSIKYEEVYLHAYASVNEARTSIGRYLAFYNSIRPHSSLGALTPDQVYFNRLPESMAA